MFPTKAWFFQQAWTLWQSTVAEINVSVHPALRTMSTQCTVTRHPLSVAIRTKILGAFCLFVLGGILVAGLWPFHAPRNDVTWQGRTNGVLFGKHGTILSEGAFTTFGSGADLSWTLEMWMQPNFHHREETFLSVYSPERPTLFRMYRFRKGIVLQGEEWGEHKRSTTAEAYIGDILREGGASFITITSGMNGTTVYLDGVAFEQRPDFRLSAKSFNGQLVVGNSTIESDSWSGFFRGLAIYDHALTHADASRHFMSWTRQGRPDIHESDRNVALYLFDEHQGNVVHNRANSGPNLTIPERYVILHEKFLDTPQDEFRADWGYLKNVLINVGGFVPLGFFFFAYWSATRQSKAVAIATVILGFMVSLSIEVGQAYLPTRDSGVTDLITNTLGTYLGVALYVRQPSLIRWGLNRLISAVLPWLRPLRVVGPIT